MTTLISSSTDVLIVCEREKERERERVINVITSPRLKYKNKELISLLLPSNYTNRLTLTLETGNCGSFSIPVIFFWTMMQQKEKGKEDILT